MDAIRERLGRDPRIAYAVGLRNLIAHQYGVIDFRRVFVVARDDVPDLVTFCQQVSSQADDGNRRLPDDSPY